MSLVGASHSIAYIPSQGRDSRIPGGFPSLEGTVLKQVADSLQPGEWHVFGGETAIGLPEGFDTFSAAYLHRSQSSSSDMWGPVHDWCPLRKQSFCVVDRTSSGQAVDRVAFGGYDAISHRWVIRRLPGDGLSTQFFGRPHVYSSWTLARDRGTFYRPIAQTLHAFNIREQQWSSIPIVGDSGGGIAYYEGRGEIIVLNSNGQIRGIDVETGVTRLIDSFGYTGHGSHIHGLYNSVRDEVFFLGDSRQYAVVNDAGIVVSGTMPVEAYGPDGSWRQSALFFDPVGGNYLLANREGGTLYEYSPALDEWREAFVASAIGFPWAVFNGFSIAAVPELGAVLWFDRNTQRLYKHGSVF